MNESQFESRFRHIFTASVVLTLLLLLALGAQTRQAEQEQRSRVEMQQRLNQAEADANQLLTVQTENQRLTAENARLADALKDVEAKFQKAETANQLLRRDLKDAVGKRHP